MIKNKKYTDIINNEIVVTSEIHPLNDKQNISNSKKEFEYFVECFINDLKKTFLDVKVFSRNNKFFVINFFLTKNYSVKKNIYFDHLDDGGTENKKRISIDFNNNDFSESIKNDKEVIVINFYAMLTKENDKILLNKDKYFYIYLNDNAITSSKIYKNIKNNIQAKINPSSRWINLNKIEGKFFSSLIELFEYKNKKGETVCWLLTKNYISKFLFDYIKQNNTPNIIDDILCINNDLSLTNTEKQSLYLARIGQGKYREDLIKLFNKKCAFSDCSELNLLVASHIKPWRDCDGRERLDKNNGILLNLFLDKLFDKFLFSFDKNGYFICRDKSIENILKRFGNMDINIIHRKKDIYQIISDKSKKYLEYHYNLYCTSNKKFKIN